MTASVIDTVGTGDTIPEKDHHVMAARSNRRSARSIGALILRKLLSAVISTAVVLGVWVGFLRVFHVPPFIGKGPIEVWRYLFTAAPGSLNGSAAMHRSAILQESMTTLRDAFMGLIGGTLVGVGAALWFSLSRVASQTFTPVAMVLRSVPLIAMTPLIVAIFGRGLVGVAIIGGVVAFFPTLINVSLGLTSASKQSIDLCRAYGAGPAATLWKVRIPKAVPGLFASLRIAAPLAFVGALLAEDLATGKGLGSTMLTDVAQSQYDGVWSRVVVATILSTALYLAIGALERSMLARFDPTSRA